MLASVIGVLLTPLTVRADNSAEVVSRGSRFDLKNVLKEEGTTVVVFIQDTSAMETKFLADLETDIRQGKNTVVGVVRLKDTYAPAAQQYEIKQTPTALVYDRFGHELTRTSQPEEIRAAIRKSQLMGRIKWVDEDDPKAPEVYGAPAAALKRGLPGIIKTMSLRPEATKMMNMISEVHFTDGFLKRREHEMVGAYVSGLNRCKF
jgi:hypothetical protein